MIKPTFALAALLLFAGQARAEEILLACQGEIKMWWERDKGGRMRTARLSNHLVKIDMTARTVGYGAKTYPISVMDEGMMRVAVDDGPYRVVMEINRLNGDVRQVIFAESMPMQAADLTCEKAQPKF